MKFPTNFSPKRTQNRLPTPSPLQAPSSPPGASGPGLRAPGPAVPTEPHAQRAQPQPRTAASLLPEPMGRAAPLPAAAPEAHTPPPSPRERWTAAPLPQAAKNVSLHTPPPCRPPPVPVPLPPPPASQWASESLCRSCLLPSPRPRSPPLPGGVWSRLLSPYLKGISHDCN